MNRYRQERLPLITLLAIVDILAVAWMISSIVSCL